MGAALFLGCVVGVSPSIVAQQNTASAQSAPNNARRILPGLQEGGEVLLPTQWSLRPAGKQLEVGDLPVNIARESSITITVT